MTALQQSKAVKLHVQPDAATALRRVHNGDETGALVVTNGKAHLYYQASSTVSGPILQAIVHGVADNLNIRASGSPPLVTVTSSSVEDRDLGYIDYLVPGLLAMAISQSAVFGIAFSLVAFRAKGILRRLRLTPMPLGEFATARVLMALCLALAQTVVLLAVGHFAFGVTFAGNLLALLPLVVLGALCFISIGLLVGSIAKTEDAAAAMANLVTLPMTFLAGVFFPLNSAPEVVRAISKVLPLTYLADGLRGVAVRDHSFMWTLPKLGVLAAFTRRHRRCVAAQLPLDVAVSYEAIVVPWASQYFASGMQEGPDAVLEAMGAPAATRVGVATLEDALAGTADAVAAAGDMPFALLGECTLAPGFLAGALRRHPDACFLWVDSHGDLNTPATSHSGFIGGMPFAVIVGWWGEQQRAACGLAPVDEARVALVGARDLDPGEASMLESSQIVAADGIAGALAGLPAGVPLVMHVDGDVLDPAVAPGVDVPGSGWLGRRAAARGDGDRGRQRASRRAQPVLREPTPRRRRAEHAGLPRGPRAAAHLSSVAAQRAHTRSRRTARRVVAREPDQPDRPPALRCERLEQLQHARVVRIALVREHVPDHPGDAVVADRNGVDVAERDRRHHRRGPDPDAGKRGQRARRVGG